jgi:hypothetical protein
MNRSLGERIGIGFAITVIVLIMLIAYIVWTP